jgi:hypothetical protein
VSGLGTGFFNTLISPLVATMNVAIHMVVLKADVKSAVKASATGCRQNVGLLKAGLDRFVSRLILLRYSELVWIETGSNQIPFTVTLV